MKCTINDIARELNMSRNTVSKALSGSQGVSVETQKLVLQKAREMDYKKFLMENAPAEPVAQGGTILLLTRSSISYSDFWVTVMKGMDEVLHKNGYNLVLGVMSGEDFNTFRFPSIMKEKIVKGIITVEISYLQVCMEILKYRLPVVTVDIPRNFEALLGKMDIITMENKVNIKKAVKLLYDKGRRRFAFAGDMISDNIGRGFQERHEAFREALTGNGLVPEENCSILDEPSESFINISLMKRKLQSMPSLPEVFFCSNDWTALHMMYTLQSMGYEIPRDVEIIGFDDTTESQRSSPALTTIHTPKEHLGMAAANTLINRIQNPALPFVYSQFSTELILRGSTSL